MSFQTTALVLAWVAIVLLGLALSGLLRQIHLLRLGQVRPQLHSGPVVGMPAPELGRDNRRPRTAVLLFSDRGCASCDRLLPEFEALAREDDGLEFKVLFPGSPNGFESGHVDILGGQAETFARFRIPATPYGVAVDSEGTVAAAGPIGSSSLLREFVGSLRKGERSDDS
jgi:hypothetical protein